MTETETESQGERKQRKNCERDKEAETETLFGNEPRWTNCSSLRETDTDWETYNLACFRLLRLVFK